jgi:hypothetical protein
MRNLIATGALVLAVAATSAFAQEPPTAPTQPSPPPTPSATTPAPIRAQKAKKVWTNDELSDLSGINITTATATQTAEPAAADAAAGDKKELPPEKDPKWYRSKLEPLRAQLSDLEAKIADIENKLKNPIDGKNAIKLGQQAPNLPKIDQPADYQAKRPDDSIFGNEVVRPEDQLVVYKQKRDAVRAQIDDLEALARQNYIPPGDIR